MNRKLKLRYRAVLSLILSAVLFCMLVVTFSMNGNNVIDVRAEGSEEKGIEGEKENETVSGNDTYPVSTYKKPNVLISINKPDGWFNDTISVTFKVADIAYTGNFEIAKMQAKVGQNGSWTDITEDKKLDISENCTIYVQVTDQKGYTYERSRAVKCFDTTKPVLNAAVSDGLLSVQVTDRDSGAKVVYVNGYEFTELTNGTLNIRLQQFDAGYEYFTISTMDNAGNMSEVYKTKNPYYKDPADESNKNLAEQLPVNAEATKPGNATGTVTEHIKTDNDENTISQKEFYTIQTASGKIFYLIIDHDGEEEMVHFLTEITENDLLNTTSDNSETLPKNSVALESAIPIKESTLPKNNGEMPEGIQQTEENSGEAENIEDAENAEETELGEKLEEPNPTIFYIFMGVLAIVFIGGAYYFKIAHKKKENFIEDEDEDEDDNEKYENEDEEPKSGFRDNFFDDKEDE